MKVFTNESLNHLIDNASASELKNKKLVVLGDSLSSHDTVQKPWPDYLIDLGVIVNNFAVGGATLTTIAENNITNQLASIPTNFDGTIFVLIGGNDGLNNVKIGSNFDDVTTTFKGALKQLIYFLQNNYPHSTLLFGTIPKIIDADPSVQEKLLNYVNATLEICALCSVPCLNLYSNLGITPTIPAMKDLYFQNDNIHFTEAGQAFLALKIEKFISNPILNNYVSSYSYAGKQEIISSMVKSINIVDDLPEIEEEGVLYLVKEQENVKNLLDDAIIINGYISLSNNSINQSNLNDKLFYFLCEGNKKYKINKEKNGVRFRVATTDTTPTFGMSVNDLVKDDNASSIIINTSSTAKYIIVNFWSSNDEQTFEDVFSGMSIEEI